MRKFILAGAAVLALAGSASARPVYMTMDGQRIYGNCRYEDENGARVCSYRMPNGNFVRTRTTDETRKTTVRRPDGSVDVTTEPIDDEGNE